MLNESLLLILGQEESLMELLSKFGIYIFFAVAVAWAVGKLFGKKKEEGETDENLEELAEQRKRQLAHLAKKRQEELVRQGGRVQAAGGGNSKYKTPTKGPALAGVPKELSDTELRRRAAVIREQRRNQESTSRIREKANDLEGREQHDPREVERLRAKAAEQRREAEHMEQHRLARLKDLQKRGEEEQRRKLEDVARQRAAKVEVKESAGAYDIAEGIGSDAGVELSFDLASVRRAVVMQEVLMPPVGMRENF